MIIDEIQHNLRIRQKELAKILNVTTHTLMNWRKSEKGMPVNYLFLLKKIYKDKINLEVLFSKDEIFKNFILNHRYFKDKYSDLTNSQEKSEKKLHKVNNFNIKTDHINQKKQPTLEYNQTNE